MRVARLLGIIILNYLNICRGHELELRIGYRLIAYYILKTPNRLLPVLAIEVDGTPALNS